MKYREYLRKYTGENRTSDDLIKVVPELLFRNFERDASGNGTLMKIYGTFCEIRDLYDKNYDFRRYDKKGFDFYGYNCFGLDRNGKDRLGRDLYYCYEDGSNDLGMTREEIIETDEFDATFSRHLNGDPVDICDKALRIKKIRGKKRKENKK